MEPAWKIRQDNFKLNIYRRIQIAAAVFVIKATGKDKTPEANATDLQQRLKLFWLTTLAVPKPGALQFTLNQYLLTQQQDALARRLCSVVSQSSYPCMENHPMQPGNDDSFSEHCNCSDEMVNPDYQKQMKANANFIQGIVQLKTLADLHLTIPMKSYITSVSKLTDGKCAEENIREVTPFPIESLLSSEDSGFLAESEPGEQNNAKSASSVSGVASSMLLYIVNSCNADQLLIKSVEAILSQLRAMAQEPRTAWSVSNFNEIIDSWAGSVYQQALRALHFVVDLRAFRPDIACSGTNLCLSFIQELIADIRSNATSKDSHYFKENQIVILFKLCEGSYLWFHAMEFIIQNLKDLVISVSSQSQNFPGVPSQRRHFTDFNSILDRTIILEQSFYLLKIAETFLIRASNCVDLICSKNIQHSPHEPNEHQGSSTIGGLWRKHYNVSMDHLITTTELKDKLRKAKSDVKHWKNILEECAVLTLDDYPTSAVLLLECVHYLPTLTYNYN